MALVLDPSEDFLTVAAAEEHMNGVAVQREEELDKIQSELRCASLIPDTCECALNTCPRNSSLGTHPRCCTDVVNQTSGSALRGRTCVTLE